jgi:DNA mismatch repair protein MutS
MHESLCEIFSIEKALKASDTAFCFQSGKAPRVDALEEELERLSQEMKHILKVITDWIGLGTDALRLEFRETMSPTITGPKASILALKRSLEAKAGTCPFKKMELINKKSSCHLEVPEIVSTWYAIQRNKASLQEAIRVAIGPLCDEITASNLYNWDELENWLALVDVSYTIWKRSKEYNFVKPVLLEGSQSSIHVDGLRHPLIERQATKIEYVKHRVELDNDANGWLVYGMNASGKSSLMKAVGIAVLLAQAGAYVPATSFEFVPFQSLFTRILNADNLWAGLSSFAVEMTELREILGRANANTLVLGDELCSGTESISATALVGASLKHLHKSQAKFIFATHFHGLLTIPSVLELKRLRVWHLKVRYDSANDLLVYERTLNPGPGSSLYGLEVARAMNLPEEILQEALSIRKGLLGTGDVLTAPLSEWNGKVQRRVCEICSANILNDLEVHHIQPRAETVDSHNKDGTHQNDLRNLIVVCSKCHDSIHNSTMSVGTVSLTSKGPKRSIITKESISNKKGFSDEDTRVIEEYLKEYPNVTPKRAIFDLEQRGITISASSLKEFRRGD